MRQERHLNLLEAFLGLLLAPMETTRVLLAREQYGTIYTIFFLLACSVTVPAVTQHLRNGYELEGYLRMTFGFFGAGIIVFGFLEWLFMRLLSIELGFRDTIAVTIFALTPLTFSLWLIFGFNVAVHGRLTIITYLMTGFSTFPDSFLQVIPFAVVITLAYMALVLFCALQVLGQLSRSSALIGLLFSLVPAGIGLAAGILCAEILHPGSIDMFYDLYMRVPRLPRLY